MGIGTQARISAFGGDRSAAEFAEVTALVQLVEHEEVPGDVPLSVSERMGTLRHPRPRHRTDAWLATLDGAAVGWLQTLLDLRPANRGFLEIEELVVHPDHRRQGIASDLVRTALAELEAAEPTSVIAWSSTDAGRCFVERLGLTFRQEERQSRLRVAELDEAQQDDWIAAPAARAAGYRVETWTGPVSEDLLEPWLVARDAMADAPLDEVDWTHESATSEWVREIEEMLAARGAVRVSSLALAADGSAAGMTFLDVHPDRPQVAHQEDTAVVPAHRGNRLGRWLKAANLRAARQVIPTIEVVETYNAESNGPMLDINVAMGFRPWRTYLAYQADAAEVGRALDRR